MDTATREENLEKYRNYKELFPRLNRAVKNEFYYEAIFIAYGIVEDRAESILRHLGKWDAYEQECTSKKKYPTISGKITRIRREAKKRTSPAHAYFSDSLLSEILTWKDKRNEKIHELMNQPFSTEELKELAETGKNLARTFSNRVEGVKRAIRKAEQT